MDALDAEVIVVGAGPTGLMLAGELRLHGISVLVLEKLAEATMQSRALGFSARAVEEFDLRGILASFGEINTIPIGHFGGLALDFRVIPGGSYGARGIPQARTEAVLGERAARLGAEIRRRHEVIGLDAGPEGVVLDVRTPDGTERLRAAYVVGCDGAHSAVRVLAGIGFPGTGATMEMWLMDVAGTNLRPRFSGERVPGGMVMVLPAGPGVQRLGIYVQGTAPRGDAPLPSYAQLAEYWQRLTGEDIADAQPLWISSFTDACRQAENYRRGRVLLAGDAAHIHPPQGAQGMSGGIGDALNLGWKLAAELRGRAPEGLLDSYNAERHPVGERVLANTLAQRILYLGDDELDALREVFGELLALEPVQQHLAGMVSALDIKYFGSPGAHPLLGARLPDLPLDAGRSAPAATRAFELLHSGRPVLLDITDDARALNAAAGWADRVDLVHAAAKPEDAAAWHGAGAVLVRPDGYVAWVGEGAGEAFDRDALDGALGRWFGAPAPIAPVAAAAQA